MKENNRRLKKIVDLVNETSELQSFDEYSKFFYHLACNFIDAVQREGDPISKMSEHLFKLAEISAKAQKAFEER